MIIKKKTLGIAALLGVVILGITVGVVSATNDVTIVTSPVTTVNLELDGVAVGTFPLYEGSDYIHITWDAYGFPAGANGAYRISLFQNTTPLEAEPTWVEIKVNHDWADNPAGTEYDMGPFIESDHLCTYCPSFIAVQPETFEGNADDGGEPFTYTLLGASYSTTKLASLTQSELILVSGIAKPEPAPVVCVPTVLGCGTGNDGIDNNCDGTVDDPGEYFCP